MICLTIFSTELCATGQVLLLHHANRPISKFCDSMEHARRALNIILEKPAIFPFVTAIFSGIDGNKVLVETYTRSVLEKGPSLIALHESVFQE